MESQPLDLAYGFWRAPLPQAREALAFIASRGQVTVQSVLERAPVADRARLQLSLMWMCKLGMLDRR